MADWAQVLMELGRAEDAERVLTDAGTRYQQSLDQILAFRYLEHPEKTRVFFAYCGLARICHIRKDWVATKKEWEGALYYGIAIWPGDQANNWNRKHFYPAVVILSLADVHYEMGDTTHGDALWEEVRGVGSAGVGEKDEVDAWHRHSLVQRNGAEDEREGKDDYMSSLVT